MLGRLHHQRSSHKHRKQVLLIFIQEFLLILRMFMVEIGEDSGIF